MEPKTHPRPKNIKETQQTFDEDQIEASQPLLVDPLIMYFQDHNNQDMTQKTLSNTPTMRFPSNTSPTHGMVQ